MTSHTAALYLVAGTLLAAVIWLIYRLRKSAHALREEVALATARAERLNTIFNTTVDGMVVISERGEIETFNRAAEGLFGYTESEVVGRNVSMLMPAPYHDEHDAYVKRYLDTGQPRIIGTGRQVRGLRRDGTEFPLHLSVGEMRIDGARKFAGVLHDLSDRARLDEQLREQAAMARLGEMAAVIAHEVKNPLAGIRGAIQVIGGRMVPEQQDQGMIREIINRIDALDHMMRDLLLFARPPKPKRGLIDMLPMLSGLATLLKEDAALRDIEFEIDGSAPPFLADAEMLRMVLQNLMINGVHAMHGRGRIRIVVNTTEQMCHITVSDAGAGIPPELREKVFLPFFTTKARGTGLGLATAKRFVEAHNGRISIDCPPTGGTTVRVELPSTVP
ncbi:MAG: PAS domain S-box protein [Vicinamibacterales bacterium]